ncbi:MAG: MBL fold metallo-hydrolase, partial [Allosphingosinicella sp.]
MRHAVGIAILAAAVAGPATAAQTGSGAAGVAGNLELAPLTDRVHIARQPDRLWAAVIGNVTIVEQSDGFVLIDAGGAAGDGRRIVSFVRGLGAKPVKAVLVTHWHGDHHFGLGPIVAAWPRARIIATAATRDLVLSAATSYAPLRPGPAADTARLNRMSGTIAAFTAQAADPALPAEVRQGYALESEFVRARMNDVAGTYVVLPTETFEQRLLIDDPVAPVELRFIGRGNTAGDAIAWLPRQRVLITGDMVIAPTPYAYNVSAGDWAETLRVLRGFDAAWLVPGHGAPQRDFTHVDRMIAALDETRAAATGLAG